MAKIKFILILILSIGFILHSVSISLANGNDYGDSGGGNDYDDSGGGNDYDDSGGGNDYDDSGGNDYDGGGDDNGGGGDTPAPTPTPVPPAPVPPAPVPSAPVPPAPVPPGSGGGIVYYPPPTINIRANNSEGPISIPYGTSAYLDWSGSNAYSCWASGDWSGLKPDFGSAQTDFLTSSKTYAISCYGQAGVAVDSVTVNISPSSLNLSVKKSVRNVNRNTPFQESVYAFPSETLSFKIEIESLSAQVANNVILRDILPSKIIYKGNLRVGNQTISGDLVSGLSLGILNLNQKKEITFDAEVDSKSEFISGLTVLTNQAGIRADNFNEIFDPAVVNVNNLPNQTGLTVSKLAKNITRSDEAWKEEIEAEPGDTLQIQIKITNTANIAVNDVKVKDIMSSKITYLGNLIIDGQENNQNIKNGINLGTISGSQAKIITFNVKLAGKNDFSYGLTELINVANIYDGNFSLFDTAKINVTKKQVAGATDVITGINVFHISLIVAFILSLALYFVIFYLENSKNSLIRKAVKAYYKTGLFILR